MFWNDRPTGPWSCARCGSHNVELRNPGTGHPALDKLRDLLDDRRHPWGEKRIVCKDCGHESVIRIM